MATSEKSSSTRTSLPDVIITGTATVRHEKSTSGTQTSLHDEIVTETTTILLEKSTSDGLPFVSDEVTENETITSQTSTTDVPTATDVEIKSSTPTSDLPTTSPVEILTDALITSEQSTSGTQTSLPNEIITETVLPENSTFDELLTVSEIPSPESSTDVSITTNVETIKSSSPTSDVSTTSPAEIERETTTVTHQSSSDVSTASPDVAQTTAAHEKSTSSTRTSLHDEIVTETTTIQPEKFTSDGLPFVTTENETVTSKKSTTGVSIVTDVETTKSSSPTFDVITTSPVEVLTDTLVTSEQSTSGTQTPLPDEMSTETMVISSEKQTSLPDGIDTEGTEITLKKSTVTFPVEFTTKSTTVVSEEQTSDEPTTFLDNLTDITTVSHESSTPDASISWSEGDVTENITTVKYFSELPVTAITEVTSASPQKSTSSVTTTTRGVSESPTVTHEVSISDTSSPNNATETRDTTNSDYISTATTAEKLTETTFEQSLTTLSQKPTDISVETSTSSTSTDTLGSSSTFEISSHPFTSPIYTEDITSVSQAMTSEGTTKDSQMTDSYTTDEETKTSEQEEISSTDFLDKSSVHTSTTILTTTASPISDYTETSSDSYTSSKYRTDKFDHESTTAHPTDLATLRYKISSDYDTTTEFEAISTASYSPETTTLNTICVTANGFYPNPVDCTTFYQCAKGVPIISHCAGTDHFNPVLKRCEDPCQAKCDLSLNCPTTETESSSVGTTTQVASVITDEISSTSETAKTESSSDYAIITEIQTKSSISGEDLISTSDSTLETTSSTESVQFLSTTVSEQEFTSTEHTSHPSTQETTKHSSILTDTPASEVDSTTPDLSTKEMPSSSASYDHQSSTEGTRETDVTDSSPSDVSVPETEDTTKTEAITSAETSYATTEEEIPSSSASYDQSSTEGTRKTDATDSSTSDVSVPETESTAKTEAVTTTETFYTTTVVDDISSSEENSSEYEVSSESTDYYDITSTLSHKDTSSQSPPTSPVTKTTECEGGDCSSSSKVPMLSTPVPYTVCHRNDLLPRPNCNEYVDCTEKVPSKRKCSMGLHFNPTTRVCDWPYSAECGKIPKPLYEPDESFHCPCQSCIIASSESCSHYYLCLGYTAYHLKCSNNLVFDRKLNTCNYAVAVDCFVSTTSTTTVSTVPTKPSTVPTKPSTVPTKPSTVPTKPSTVYTTKSTPSTTRSSTLSTTTSEPERFVCPRREGLFKYPESCSFFYQCSNWYPYKMRCAPTTHFSEITQRCEYPCDAKCDLSLPCKTTENDSPNDPRCTCRNCKLPAAETCTKYIVCFNGKARLENCPWGQTFDVKRNACDWAHKVKCGHSEKCPELNGLFPHKEDCHKFVHCSNGIPYEKKCPSVLEYDPVTKRCEWPSGKCSYSLVAKEADIFKEEEHKHGWRCPKTFGSFSDEHHCNRFYHCSLGTPSLKECSEGLLYNHRQQTCDWKKHVRCNSNRHQVPRRCRVYDRHVTCPRDRTPQPHSHCNMYYDCTAGRACAKQCPVGLYFNRTSGTCDLPANVKCYHDYKEYSLKEFSKSCERSNHKRMPNPTNDSCFYHCRQGKVISGCCSKGHVYNQRTDKCERRAKSFRI